MDDITLARLRSLRRDRTFTLAGGWRRLANAPEGDEVVGSELAAWVRLDREKILSSCTTDPADRHHDLIETLIEALLDPQPPFFPCLPRRIIVEDASLSREISRSFIRLGVEVVCAPVPLLDQVAAVVDEHIDVSQRWLRQEVPLEPLYAAAAGLWRRRPWDHIGGEPPILLEIHRYGVETLFGIVARVGASCGAVFYMSQADYERAGEAGGLLAEAFGASEEELPAHATEIQWDALSVFFFDMADTPREEIEFAYDEDLPIASMAAYPQFARSFATGERRLPKGDEIRALRLAIEALNRFWSRHRRRLVQGEGPISAQIGIEDGGEWVSVRVSLGTGVQ